MASMYYFSEELLPLLPRGQACLAVLPSLVTSHITPNSTVCGQVMFLGSTYTLVSLKVDLGIPGVVVRGFDAVGSAVVGG